MNDDSMNDQPIDFSVLDPTRNRARFDVTARALVRDAMDSRARRLALPHDLLSELAGWTRPALVAAAVVFAVALPMLVRSRNAAPARTTVASAADVLGIPRSLMELLQSSRTPTLAQIDQALASTDGAGR